MGNNVSQKQLLAAQRNELSEHLTYKWLAGRMKQENNREVLERIAEEEWGHYEAFKRLTQTDVSPRRFRVAFYKLISRVLGLSFGLRLMERGERVTKQVYSRFEKEYPELAEVIMDEQKHEHELLELIEDENIKYAGSIVLGLNDALVELTGALAGLTFALQDTNVIAMVGLVTGIAASMSMAASEYLSSREEDDGKKASNPVKAATYTGIAYVFTVLVLVLPYLFLDSVYAALGLMLAFSIIIILGYNFYITTAKGIRLWRRFGEMALISLGVATISFLVGIAARKVFGVEA